MGYDQAVFAPDCCTDCPQGLSVATARIICVKPYSYLRRTTTEFCRKAKFSVSRTVHPMMTWKGFLERFVPPSKRHAIDTDCLRTTTSTVWLYRKLQCLKCPHRSGPFMPQFLQHVSPVILLHTGAHTVSAWLRIFYIIALPSQRVTSASLMACTTRHRMTSRTRSSEFVDKSFPHIVYQFQHKMQVKDEPMNTVGKPTIHVEEQAIISSSNQECMTPD